jgi:hypothetical protein
VTSSVSEYESTRKLLVFISTSSETPVNILRDRTYTTLSFGITRIYDCTSTQYYINKTLNHRVHRTLSPYSTVKHKHKLPSLYTWIVQIPYRCVCLTTVLRTPFWTGPDTHVFQVIPLLLVISILKSTKSSRFFNKHRFCGSCRLFFELFSFSFCYLVLFEKVYLDPLLRECIVGTSSRGSCRVDRVLESSWSVQSGTHPWTVCFSAKSWQVGKESGSNVTRMSRLFKTRVK